MPSYQVIAAQEMRRMPAKDNFPEKAVDHLTLSANGSQVLVTMFRKLSEPLPDVGSTIEGELGESDRFDKDRRKFLRPRSGGGGGGGTRGPTHPQDAYRMGRSASHERAMLYILAKVALGKIENFDFEDVVKLTDAFQRDLDPSPPPQSEMPFDDGGLPPAKDITT